VLAHEPGGLAFQRHPDETWKQEAGMMRFLAAVIAAMLAWWVAPAAAADNYPNRTITVIVPFPAGGGVDTVARIVGEKLSHALKQQVVIDNRASGGAILGTRAVARAAPDGYTLLLGHTGTISINPNLYANAGYDPRRDFAPIGLIATIPIGLVVHPSVPATSVAELIALARREPGKLAVGTSVVGAGSYMAAELFKEAAGVDMTIVPYKGTGPLASDSLGGHVPVSFNTLAPILANILAGNLRALGVASLSRSTLLPQVPTIAEAGLPGFEAVLRYGLLAPAGTPKDIVARLNRELRTLVESDEVKSRIAADGGDTLTSTAEEYAADIDREERKWGALVRKLGLRVE
jgi:tripartite-type tricarboxylate transporter receptor subunit TctC